MDGNLACQYQDERLAELLNGKVALMSPCSLVDRNRVGFNLSRIFGNYLKGKTCEAFADCTDVYLTEKDRVIPDVMIICNQKSLNGGASTARRT